MAEGFALELEPVAEHIDTVARESEHTAVEEQDYGLGMGWGTLKTFLAWPKSWCPSWSS